MKKIIGRRSFIKLGLMATFSTLLPKAILDLDIPTKIAEKKIKPTLADGKWHHFSAIRDEGIVSISIDGKTTNTIRAGEMHALVGEDQLLTFSLDGLEDGWTIACMIQAIDQPGAKVHQWGYTV